MDQTREQAAPDACPYNAEYYACGFGTIPYARNDYWLTLFGSVADQIVRSLRPRRVLDAGCAIGMLVESFWDRGVEAHGRDISEYAISQVRQDIRQYCEVGSIAEPFHGDYDLATCIEVLEHIPEEIAIAAIREISRAAPRLIFSSSPLDIEEPTHVNVKPTIWWLRRFAEAGMRPVPGYDASFIIHHAMLLERTAEPIAEEALDAFAEIIRLRLDINAHNDRIIAFDKRARAAEANWERERAGRESAESDLQRARHEIESLQRQLEHIRHAEQALLSSTSWRVTAPLRALMSARKSGSTNAPAGPAPAPAVADAAPADAAPSPAGKTDAAYAALEPLPIRHEADFEESVTIVLDRVAADPLDRSDAVALVVGSLLAERTGRGLRLITRQDAPEAAKFAELLRSQAIDYAGNVRFVHAPFGSADAVPCSPNDLFLVTSWRTAWSARRSVEPRRLIYHVQEDERLGCETSEDALCAGEMLEDPETFYLVSSQQLFDHFCKGPSALADFAARSAWFDPAFPGAQPDGMRPAGKRLFVYCARPQERRGLYHRGLEAVSATIEENRLDPELWDICLVGANLPPVVLPRGAQVSLMERPSWTEYARLLPRTAAAMALLDAPHPSWAAIELALNGVFTVTNRWGEPESGERYGGHLICAEPRLDELVAAIGQAAELALGGARLEGSRSTVPADWRATLAPVLAVLAAQRA